MTDSTSHRSKRMALLCGSIIGVAAPIAFLYAPNFRMTWANVGIVAGIATPLAIFRDTRRAYFKGILAGVAVDVVGAFLFLAVIGFPRMG